MNFKPEGLTLPNCSCFNKKAKAMNDYIDKVSSLFMLDVLEAANVVHICPSAREYYIAAFVWSLTSLLIERRKDDVGNSFDLKVQLPPISSYRLEFEKVYDNLRPLVMQRLDYADGVIDSWGRK